MCIRDRGGVAGTTSALAQSAQTVFAQAGLAQVAPSCVVKPELTEGPYFVDNQLDRSDIRIEPSDGAVREGVPFTLGFAVSQVANSGCTPLQGAKIDVWH